MPSALVRRKMSIFSTVTSPDLQVVPGPTSSKQGKFGELVLESPASQVADDWRRRTFWLNWSLSYIISREHACESCIAWCQKRALRFSSPASLENVIKVATHKLVANRMDG